GDETGPEHLRCTPAIASKEGGTRRQGLEGGAGQIELGHACTSKSCAGGGGAPGKATTQFSSLDVRLLPLWRAECLLDCLVVDGQTVTSLQAAEVLRKDVALQLARQLGAEAFGLLGRWRGCSDDVGDAQEGARLAVLRRRGGSPALGQGKRLLDGILGQARRR